MAFLSKLFKSKKTQDDKASTKSVAKEAAKPNVVLARSPKDIPDSELLSFLLNDNDLSRSQEALARIHQPADLVSVAAQHGLAQIRFHAAEQITDPELLQQLLGLSKGKDKNVYRLCKERLASVKQAQQEQQQQQERIEYLLGQAKYLVKLGYQAEFTGKLNLLKQEWQELQNQAKAEVANELNQAISQAEAIAQQHAEEEAQRIALEAAQQEAQQHQQELVEQAAQLLEQAPNSQADELKTAITLIERAWHDAFQTLRPNAELGKAFEQHLNALNSIQTTLALHNDIANELETWQGDEQANESALHQGEAWLKRINWPQQSDKPSWLNALEAKVKALKAQAQELKQHSKQLVQQLQQQLQEMEKALKEGSAKDAGKISHGIHQALQKNRDLKAGEVRSQLRALDARLHELRDWAGFAITPKKEALIDSMQNLINAELAPDLLADKIQALQTQWKELGGGHDQELWQRFHQAADRAYEPCKAYFAELANQREAFVQQRQQLTQELASYESNMDWAQADWKLVQKTLDTARDAFKQLGPVDRGAHKTTQDAFNQVCDRIFAHLKDEYDRNLQLKTELVSKAEALAASDDLKGIVDKVKQQLESWKQVGITPRALDQKLWQQFRKACDQVFAHLNEQREQRHNEINETVAQAEALVEAALAKFNAAAEDAKAALSQARQHISSVSLPKPVHQRLSKLLQEANDEQKHQANQKEMAGLIARLTHLQGDDQDWQAACELPLPTGYTQERFNQARQLETASADNATDLCILLEIIAEISSQQDQERRMELQVQRLAEGLGKGLSSGEEIKALIERWLSVKPSAEQSSRFIRALEHSAQAL
ncbi:MAG: DUF349 domain-containing protein [Venatoribacter sp.]